MVLATLSILGALLLGAISPGPSFVLVARTAVATSRSEGVAAALGMGVGGLVFGALALFGLQAVMAQAAELFVVAKIIGGLYLLYLGYRLWRGSTTPIEPQEFSATPMRNGRWRIFLFACGTQLSNPKTALVYASIFAALLPRDMPDWTPFMLLPLIFIVETGWYTLVAVVFSMGTARAAYLKSKLHVDRAAAIVMSALGVRLIY